MSLSTALTACPNIQDLLTNHFNTNNAAYLVDQHPFFDFILSAQNRSGFSQKVSPGGGKVKTVELTYTQRILESQVTTPGSRTCTATTKRGDYVDTFTIDPDDFMQVEELLNAEDFATICRDNPTVIAEKIAKMQNALRSAAATALTTQAKAFLGGVSSDVDSSKLQDVSGVNYIKVATELSGGAVNPKALVTIDTVKTQSNWGAPAPIFGGADLWEYAKMMQAGCCSTQGLDIAAILAQYGTAVLYDRRVANALGGSEYAWTLLPGVFQAIFHVENSNMVTESAAAALGQSGLFTGANYAKGVISDPATGMPEDILVSDNCGAVSIILRANVKGYGLPSDLFASGDHMEGVTFFNGIVIDNP